MTDVSRLSKLSELQFRLNQRRQRFEDGIVPMRNLRWAGLAFAYLFFCLRIFSIEGFYVVTYALHLHLLYIAIFLITPLSDPTDDSDSVGALPNSKDQEFKPFVPKVQEYKSWRAMLRIMVICFVLTFFPIFDVPVFWPILLIYFVGLFISEVGGRVRHMMKFRYVPWSSKKPRYVSKDEK